MAVPSSGELELYGDIGIELGVAQSNVTLHGMSQTAGFSAPDAMSEFYGYSGSSPSFNTVLYTGTFVADSVTGFGFDPDMIWVKNRTNSASNITFNRVMGDDYALFPDLTDAQHLQPAVGQQFITDGFRFEGNWIVTDANASDYVMWGWKAGGAAVTNNDGTITSQVSVNVDAGFSIVAYTGNGGGGTVGHGLGVTPNIVLTKARTRTSNWSFNGNFAGLAYGVNKLALNLLAGLTADTNEVLAANSSTFTTGASSAVGYNGEDYIAYIFAEKPGISKFGSYTGNGSTSGPTITTGFEPAFVIWKKTSNSTSAHWNIVDNKRSPANGRRNVLYSNLSQGEDVTSYDVIDFNANGFQIKAPYSQFNESGATFIYMAFA